MNGFQNILAAAVLLLLAVPSAFAQGGDTLSRSVHAIADTTQVGALVTLHLGMMADPTIHAVMEGDAELHAAMTELMPEMDHGGSNEAGDLDEMDDADDADGDLPQKMVEDIEEHLALLSVEERTAVVNRAVAAHRRVLADPIVWERVAENPDLLAKAQAVIDDEMDE